MNRIRFMVSMILYQTFPSARVLAELMEVVQVSPRLPMMRTAAWSKPDGANAHMPCAR